MCFNTIKKKKIKTHSTKKKLRIPFENSTENWSSANPSVSECLRGQTLAGISGRLGRRDPLLAGREQIGGRRPFPSRRRHSQHRSRSSDPKQSTSCVVQESFLPHTLSAHCTHRFPRVTASLLPAAARRSAWLALSPGSGARGEVLNFLFKP